MVAALTQGCALRACRDALVAEGFDWQLLEGAFIFVEPLQYQTAKRALKGMSLRSSHVVVAESMEHLVEEAIVGIGKGAWAKSRSGLELMDGASTGDEATAGDDRRAWNSPEQLQVKRTFLSILPGTLPMTAVVQSDANSRNVLNPRRSI